MRNLIILLQGKRGAENVASKYQQLFKVQMQQRKRLLKANRKPLDSFNDAPSINAKEVNLLHGIKNQKLYLKLVGISLEMSRQAGVDTDTLHQIETKLLMAKGFQQFSMLNHDPNGENGRQSPYDKKNAYNLSQKYIAPEEQMCFLGRMQKQIQQVQTKEHVIYALKKYVQAKKKSINTQLQNTQNLSRVKTFLLKVKSRSSPRKIQRINFYGQTLNQIFARIMPQKNQAYETLRNMKHLKALWGHTFFSEAEQEYCPVYNVIFDNTEKLFITGGDDGKIKVWAKDTAVLISTLQGHTDYINKIIVSKNNKLILSAAQDGVRFFDLDTMTSYGGYDAGQIMDISEYQPKNQHQSYVIFADSTKVYVLPFSTILSQKDRKLEIYDFKVYNFSSSINEATQMTNTLVINPEGVVFLGLTQGKILIFDFHLLKDAEIDPQNFSSAPGMSKIPEFTLPIRCVLNAHQADILEIKWNPLLSYFSTGAKKDGVCKIWHIKSEDESNQPSLVRELRIPKHKVKRKKKVYNCNFACWNSSYTHVTCSFEQQEIEEENDNRGDGEVIVYNAMKAEVTWEMSKTIDLSSIRALDAHPFYPNIMAICDSFGKIMLTDIYENYIVNIFQERAFHLNHPSFCLVPSECRFSQDGLTLLVATQYGNVSIYGYDVKDFYQVYPTEQIFTTDYEGFQIDPHSYKPVLHGSTIDVNTLGSGLLENMHHQPYNNLVKVNPIKYRQMIESGASKQKHHNSCHILLSEVERISQSYLDNERNLEVLRQNMEEIETKRMTVLYEEKEVRDGQLKQLIQEKLFQIKQIDQNVSMGLMNQRNAPSNTSNFAAGYHTQPESHSPGQPDQEPSRVSRRGRRPRNPNNNSYGSQLNTRNHHRVSYNEQFSEAELEEQFQDRHNQREQESYQYDGEVGEEQQEYAQSAQNEEDDFDEENESSEIYINSRARRNNRKNKKTTNTNTQNVRSRPPNVAIPQLEQQYSEYGRLRKRAHESLRERSEQSRSGSPRNAREEQNKREIRRTASRLINQMRQEREPCQLCTTNLSTVACSNCQLKKYCDGCKNFRGKRVSQNNNYVCFQCYYNSNNCPEAHRNVSQEKYIMPERTQVFVPQVGDHVAYFFQGYEEFLYDKIQVINNKYLALNVLFDIVPHQNYAELANVQKCTVTDISYAFPLQQMSEISYQNKRANRGRNPTKSSAQDILALVTLVTPSGFEFRVFHTPGYEFLIKWEIYDDIVQNDRYSKLKPFDLVRIKDESVEIIELRALNQLYPDSIWKKIIVHSPDNKYLRRTREKSEDIAVNIWNIEGAISPAAMEYHCTLTKQARARYLREIQKVEKTEPKLWQIFGDFVDLDMYENYTVCVQVMMCLNLIISRLENQYYAGQQSLIKDVKLLYENSVSFNGKDHPITEMAQSLKKLILEDENFNHSNQVDNSTEKKTRPKKKLNSGSSANREVQVETKRRQEIKVSGFEEQLEQQLPRRRLRRSRPQRNQLEEQDYSEQEEEESSSGPHRPNTRHRNYAKENGHTRQAPSSNARVTRSRTKN